MTNLFIGSIAIIGTVIIYILSAKVHDRFSKPFTLPVLISTICIVIMLLIFDIPYTAYMTGGRWINEFLGPAVVALAYPLYLQRHTIKKLLIPILSGIIAGAVIGVLSGVLLAKWTGFSDEIIATVSTKSVTTPVSMAITESVGGIRPLAAILVMIAGISGAALNELLFKLFNIQHYIAKGIALGSASHAIGTATSMEKSLIQGSISSIAMVISAITVSIITPGIIVFFV
jgi:predicted murein hydrolase (TIGR00659 family)